MKFKEKFDRIVNQNDSLLCLGLDPELDKLPKYIKKSKNPYFEFNKQVIDTTHDLVCAYKPNIAFYEALGLRGLLQLQQTILYLQKKYPEVPIVMDAKRGDIGNTMKMYAESIFKFWKVDAVTVHPFLGLDALQPFFEYKDKLIILLIKFSNPDSKMFQDLEIGKEKYYLHVAKKISKWPYENIGIMVGATYPEEMREIRLLFPDSIFLSPGLGAQGGKAEDAVKAGIDKKKKGIMFNASRSILYASSGKDFAEKAREEALKMRNTINNFRI